MSVSCRCPKWRFDYPRLHQAPYNFIPNHPVSPFQFDSMNNAEIGWKFQHLPPSIGSLLRLIVLVSPPVYFVRLHPICRRYRGTLGRNGSALPLHRLSIFLLKHCLRGFVYCTRAKFPRPNSFLFSSQYVCLCSTQAQKQTKTKGKKKKKTSQSNPIQFNSFGGIHSTSTDPVSPYSCSTTFPILTDVPPDPQSHIRIYYLVLQLFLRVGILLLPPGPNQAPDLTKPSCRPWRWRPDDRRGPITIGSIGQFIGDVQGPRTVMHFVVVPSDRTGDELLYAASP